MAEANERVYGPGSIAASDQHVSEMAEALKKSAGMPSLLLLGHEDRIQLILNFAGKVAMPVEWNDDDPRMQLLYQALLIEFLGACMNSIEELAFKEIERMMSE